MFQRLKENIGKGAMQRISSSNLIYLSSIAGKLAICMGIKMKMNEKKRVIISRIIICIIVLAMVVPLILSVI